MKTLLANTLKQYLKVVLLWCPAVSVLFIFGFGSFDHFLVRFSISLSIAVMVSSCCFVGSFILEAIYNSYRQKRNLAPRGGVLWGIISSYPFLLPGLYLGFQLAERVSTRLGHAWTAPSWNDYSSGIIFGIMVSGFFTLFEVLKETKITKQETELRVSTLENEKLKAQISALSAQMNPHLLFNSLNTIASTISSDPQSAEDMVVQLSELYRGILKSAKGEEHSLEEELALCRSYLEIEQKRFGSRIGFSFEVDPKLDLRRVRIPVLLVQPLVENSIKHGLNPRREGGFVSISVERKENTLMIQVADNGVGVQPNKISKGSGTGMTNCRSRIQLKYGAASDFRFSHGSQQLTTATISIPLVSEPVS